MKNRYIITGCFVGFVAVLLGLQWLSSSVVQSQVATTTQETLKQNFVESPPGVISMSFSHTAADFTDSSATQSVRIPLDKPHYRFATMQIRSATLVSGDIGVATYQVKVTASANEIDDDIYTLPYKSEFDNTGNQDVWHTIPTIENYGAYMLGDWVLSAQAMVIVANGVDNVSREVEISFE